MIGPLNTAFCVGFTLVMSNYAVASAIVDPSGNDVRRATKFWGEQLCRRCEVEVRTRGGESVAWSEPLVVMANHQSLFDIPVLYAALPKAFGMLAKQELFRVPFFGAAMREVGCVPIDRDDRRSSRESIREAAERVRAGRSIVVFPEGTRSKDGRIQGLKKGPFHLVQLAEVPIVPVGIHGTRDVLSRDGLVVRGGTVEVAIGEPIRIEPGLEGRERARSAVRERLIELSGMPEA